MDSREIRTDAAAPGATREPALAGLFRAHCVELTRLAQVLLGERERAEEAVLAAYRALFRQWPPRDDRSALAFLRSEVVDRAGSQRRGTASARRGPPLTQVGALDGPTGAEAEQAFVARDEPARLAEQVRGLPRRQREVITCRYYLLLGDRETADFLEMRVGSVRRQAHRGLASLAVMGGGIAMNGIERRVSQGLRTYGEGLGMTTEDVDRLEGELERKELPSPTRRRGQLWQGAVAACAVAGVVLGALALFGDREARTERSDPPPITPAQLEGIWRVADSRWLWRFAPDGTVTVSEAPDLLTGVGVTTAFTVRPTPGGFISENLSTGCSAAWAATIAPEGRMSARARGQSAACTGAADPPGGVWELTRVSPVSVAGAATLPDRASQDPLAVTDLTPLTGTWLLRGTGTLLTVDPSARYAVQDLGATTDPETGSVTVQPSGRVTFTPQDAPRCTAVYGSVITTDTALDSELAPGSCTRLAATSDTWIRLN